MSTPADQPRALVVLGPLGTDSPYADEALPLSVWHAWLDIGDDRAAGHCSPRWRLEDALGKRLEPMWGLWWHHRTPVGGWQIHRARVYCGVHSGDTVVSACLLSAPFTGPGDTIRAVASVTPDETWPRCAVCTDRAGDR